MCLERDRRRRRAGETSATETRAPAPGSARTLHRTPPHRHVASPRPRNARTGRARSVNAPTGVRSPARRSARGLSQVDVPRGGRVDACRTRLGHRRDVSVRVHDLGRRRAFAHGPRGHGRVDEPRRHGVRVPGRGGVSDCDRAPAAGMIFGMARSPPGFGMRPATLLHSPA